MNIVITTVSSQPQILGAPQPGGRSLMALTRASGNEVFGRTVPQNQIFRARLDEQTGRLEEFAVVLDTQQSVKPAAVGYEDPTYISTWEAAQLPGRNQGPGLLLTVTHAKTADPADGLSCDLAYYDLVTMRLETLITPQNVMYSGLSDTCDMAKEGEILEHEGKTWLLFEYSDKTVSQLGVGQLDGGQIVAMRALWTVQKDASEHVSTSGRPVSLGQGKYLLFFNRRRNNEWGVTSMMIDLTGDWPVIEDVASNWHIRAGGTELGPGDQLIAFGSCVTPVPNHQVEILYHINDAHCARQILQIDQT